MSASHICRLLDRIEQEDTAERETGDQRWMLAQWVQARTLYHGLTSNGDLPPTKAEHEGKKKPSWGKIEQARKQRIKHDEEWMEALSDPRRFGVLMGLGHILGEPEPKTVIPARSVDLTESFASRLDSVLGETG